MPQDVLVANLVVMVVVSLMTVFFAFMARRSGSFARRLATDRRLRRAYRIKSLLCWAEALCCSGAVAMSAVFLPTGFSSVVPIYVLMGLGILIYLVGIGIAVVVYVFDAK